MYIQIFNNFRYRFNSIEYILCVFAFHFIVSIPLNATDWTFNNDIVQMKCYT